MKIKFMSTFTKAILEFVDTTSWRQKNRTQINARKVVVSIFLLGMPFISNQVLALRFKQPEKLNVLAYSEFRPISYAAGSGYEGDLLRAVAKVMGVPIQFHAENTYEGIWRLPSRDYTNVDIAMGGITPLDSRRSEGAAFSVATTHFSQSLLVRKNDYLSGKITSYNSFKHTNGKIGVVAGTTGEYFAQLRAKASGLPSEVIVKYPSEKQLLPALRGGEIAAIARGNIGNDYQASLDDHFVTIDKKDYQEQFAFAVDKNNPELLTKLNLAISYLTDNGKIDYRQWQANHHIFDERVTYRVP